MMRPKTLIIMGLATLWVSPLLAKRGDGDRRPRPETITCGLAFDASNQLEAEQSILVQNAQAVLRGEARGVSYVFSVRGKTAIARITEGDQVINAQGAIEMLRHGGEDRSTRPNGAQILRRGEDDANDGTPEREAGFQLSLGSPQAPTRPRVSLKCESVNQTAQTPGVTQ